MARRTPPRGGPAPIGTHGPRRHRRSGGRGHRLTPKTQLILEAIITNEPTPPPAHPGTWLTEAADAYRRIEHSEVRRPPDAAALTAKRPVAATGLRPEIKGVVDPTVVVEVREPLQAETNMDGQRRRVRGLDERHTPLVAVSELTDLVLEEHSKHPRPRKSSSTTTGP
jgi:hypothetical protein